MTSMLNTYKNITARTDSESAIHDKEFVVMEQCRNDYHHEQIATIPAGTTIIGDFAGDFGCYAMAEIRGVMHKIKIDVNELHKVNWGNLDARNL